MTRWLWMIGLSFALLVFGGWAVVILITGLRHRHLNGRGWIALTVTGYIAWFTFQYLLVKIRNQPYVPEIVEEPVEIPRLL